MLEIDGRAWVLHAFDVGRKIDLARCRTLLETQEVAGARRPEWPHLFGLDERPLVVTAPEVRVAIGEHEVPVHTRIILYDFGNVSVALSFPLASATSAALLAPLGRTPALGALARARLDEVIGKVISAVTGPRPIIGPHRFVVVQADDAPGGDPAAYLARCGADAARFLRDEPGALADEEVKEALARSIRYGASDLVVIGSSRAIVLDDEWEDTLAVIDFASCERLTMEALDEELDTAIEAAAAMQRSRGSRLRHLMNPWGRPLAALTRLTLSVTTEFEAAENAIKLTGDDYLARVYRIAIERLHVRAFQNGIERKLQTLWNIQQVFLEQAATRRSELLEWMIILLIAFEVVRALV